ncbi:hypothetical protein Afil01_22470 [Actinorhabdospora filicis]|uniref:DUF4352 domain-containing protein n=1 Tax=Actinorhabdospora filicis TaxID=1785913 RepID=A0A9W6SHX8_9ACTN|nr:hypothetical protein [Actinorhabdospora filicis]GLZ77440.1 hypothetical protein Afil01_22470 [Actinorhabdospora filicis]
MPASTVTKRLAVAGLCLALLAGCKIDPVGPLSGESGDADAGAAGAPDGFSARSVAYMNADIDVTGMSVGTRVPAGWGADSTLTKKAVYLRVKVTNRLQHAMLLLDDGIYLDPGDGKEIPLGDSDDDITGAFDPGAGAEGWYAFELPGTMTAPALVLGKPDARRERLPLTGNVPAPEYPKTLNLTSTLTVRYDDCVLTVKPEKAYLAHWVGFEHEGISEHTEQAAKDRLKLYLGVTLTAAASSNGCFVYDQDVRLVVDGKLQSGLPELSSANKVDAGASSHDYVVFDVPASGQVAVEWGRQGSAPQRLTIPVP